MPESSELKSSRPHRGSFFEGRVLALPGGLRMSPCKRIGCLQPWGKKKKTTKKKWPLSVTCPVRGPGSSRPATPAVPLTFSPSRVFQEDMVNIGSPPSKLSTVRSDLPPREAGGPNSNQNLGLFSGSISRWGDGGEVGSWGIRRSTVPTPAHSLPPKPTSQSAHLVSDPP
ncbi:hypothetical protein SKAU_G00104330 [Synaphobranchus kaupii]|uniref:Uncharacterized protein n=1 Tax=Synaphobranchus kaupii TaxID=118154 RepID=A0A9Q1G021_SYNKA|nr:hypothetical protein SKAU_G00104330 [Synaphobranchus kaupii]